MNFTSIMLSVRIKTKIYILWLYLYGILQKKKKTIGKTIGSMVAKGWGGTDDVVAPGVCFCWAKVFFLNRTINCLDLNLSYQSTVLTSIIQYIDYWLLPGSPSNNSYLGCPCIFLFICKSIVLLLNKLEKRKCVQWTLMRSRDFPSLPVIPTQGS